MWLVQGKNNFQNRSKTAFKALFDSLKEYLDIHTKRKYRFQLNASIYPVELWFKMKDLAKTYLKGNGGRNGLLFPILPWKSSGLP